MSLGLHNGQYIAGNTGKPADVLSADTGKSGDSSPSFRQPVALGRAVVRHALAADVPFMAGAIAY